MKPTRLAWLIIVALLPSGCELLFPPREPNVVILFADDLGYCDTDLYECNEIPTPNIHRIADNGVLFTDGYVTAGTCSPSRAGLLTGRNQQRFGFEFNTGSAQLTFDEKRGLPFGEATIADEMANAGYATGMVGKWHQGNTEGYHPTERGFTEFFGFLPGARAYFDQPADGVNAATRRVPSPHRQARLADIENIDELRGLYRGRERIREPEYLTDAFAREAAGYIERHKEEPFFLYVAFNAPHTPIETTEKYAERFGRIGDPHRRVYAAMVSGLDDAVGVILDKLDETELTEDTIVFFLSDNGCATYTEACTNDPLRLGKAFLFEGGVRVPFAVQYPRRLDGGEVFRKPVSSLDILPTAVGLAGGELPAGKEYDGVDLMPYLRGRDDGDPHEALFWRNGSNRAIRSGDWKLFWNQHRDWLFNLDQDVGESRDLSADHPEKIRELKGIYREWEQQMGEPAWPFRRAPIPPFMVDGVEVDLNI